MEFFLIFLTWIHVSFCLEELIQANIYFRHGNRYPTKSFPKEEYKDLFKDNYGQLTQKGLITEYNLGLVTRQRYVETYALLWSSYSHLNVLVTSSDVDRTLMSGQAFLAGLFIPKSDQYILKNLTWSPVPIHTVPVADDHIHRSTHSNCPKLLKEINKRTENMNEKKIDKQIYENLVDITGFSHIDSLTLWSIYDNIRVKKDMNLNVDPYFTDNVIQQMLHVINEQQLMLFKIDHDYEFGKLLSGPLITNLLDKIQKRNRFVNIHSCHETTLAYLHSALELDYVPSADYGDATSVELWKLSNNSFEVKVFWRKSGGDYVLAKDYGSLENFVAILSRIKSLDREKECSIKAFDKMKVALYVLSFCLIILLCIMIILLMRYKRNIYKSLN